MLLTLRTVERPKMAWEEHARSCRPKRPRRAKEIDRTPKQATATRVFLVVTTLTEETTATGLLSYWFTLTTG